MKTHHVVLVGLILVLMVGARTYVLESVVPGQVASAQQVEFTHAIERVARGEVAKATVSGDMVELEERTGARMVTRKEPGVSLIQTLQIYGVPTEHLSSLRIEVQEPGSELGSFGLPLVGALMVLALVLLTRRSRPSWLQGSLEGAAFRRSTARVHVAAKSSITFDDVAGTEEAKQELKEVVEFLRAPDRFTRLGARVPRGLLLIGAPGTGKTLLARATAGEAGVSFLSCSGTEFVEMYVGVGAARIRDLFQRAKKCPPCIVFIDEIDALGKRRSSGWSNEEREHALNQILVEMDGFDQNSGVVVMAATNRPDVLDPALLRPGRFDRRITVDSPDLKDRIAILRVHSRRKPLSEEVDLERIAKQTTGLAGADLENVMNEAALLAARHNRDRISASDLEEAIDRATIGLANKSRAVPEREKRIAAYHEAGHALVAYCLPHADPIRKLSIVPRGSSGGHTRLTPSEDRRLWSRAQLCDAIAFAMGGMVAEDLVFGDTTTGSASDLLEATSIARKMVGLFGMSQLLGPYAIASGAEGSWVQGLSESTANSADAEIRRLLEEGRERASTILRIYRCQLTSMAEGLLHKETLQDEDLQRVLADVPRPGVAHELQVV